jgi:hypothetical protein
MVNTNTNTNTNPLPTWLTELIDDTNPVVAVYVLAIGHTGRKPTELVVTVREDGSASADRATETVNETDALEHFIYHHSHVLPTWGGQLNGFRQFGNRSYHIQGRLIASRR